jgi:hypothetical protein
VQVRSDTAGNEHRAVDWLDGFANAEEPEFRRNGQAYQEFKEGLEILTPNTNSGEPRTRLFRSPEHRSTLLRNQTERENERSLVQQNYHHQLDD